MPSQCLWEQHFHREMTRCHLWVVPPPFKEQTERNVSRWSCLSRSRQRSFSAERSCICRCSVSSSQSLADGPPTKHEHARMWLLHHGTEVHKAGEDRTQNWQCLSAQAVVSSSFFFFLFSFFFPSHEEWFYFKALCLAPDHFVCNSKAHYYSCMDWR